MTVIDKLIESMIKGGFYVDDVTDAIRHDSYGQFPTWEAAIVACIEVATEQ